MSRADQGGAGPSGGCPSENVLLELIEGTLPDAISATTRDHLDRCHSCRKAAALAVELADESDPRPTASPDDERAEAPRARVAAGTRIGRYRVEGLLGIGGMGVIYAARDDALERRVALKLLRPELSDAGELEKVLIRESRAMARLAHPNVLSVHDIGSWSGRVFIAMELVDGETVTRWLRRKRRSWREVLEVFSQAGRGLAAAHQAGIVHRDFKPDNVLVDARGRVLVTDFGVARPLGEHAEASAGATESAALSTTRSSLRGGTPAYMAPEQFGGAGDVRSDIFSYCVSLYEALYGERPFPGQSAAELVDAIRRGAIRVAAPDTEVPAALRRALRRGLAAEPDARFASMEELLAALTPPSRRRARWAALAGAIAAVIFAIAVTATLSGRGGAPGPHAPYPDDPATRAAVAVVRHELAAADALRLAGDYRGSMERLEPLFERADELDYGPLRSELLYLQGVNQGNLGDWRQGWQTILRAANMAEAHRHEVVAAHAWIDLLKLMEGERIDLARAEEYAARAGAPVDRLGGDEVLEERFLFNLATLRLRQERWSEAEELFEQAIALIEPHDPARAAKRREGLGVAYLDQGRYAEAKATFIEVLEAHRHDLGPEHPNLGFAYLNLGAAHLYLGELDEALAHTTRALELTESVSDGETSVHLVRILQNLGELHRMRGDHEVALPYLERAHEIVEHTLGPGHPKAADVLGPMGVVLLGLERTEEAVAALGQAIEVLVPTHGDDHVAVANLRLNLGIALAELARYDEALDAQRRGLEAFERSYDDTHPLLGHAHAIVGMTLLKAGQRAEAVAPLERALAIYSASDYDPAQIASAKFDLARALGRRGPDAARARRLAQEAVRTWEQLPDWHDELEDAIRWLGGR